ncbi:MAG: hypothetical protein ULS35scaffold63_32 [Phage 33_17]|nr:MAG: hypothetical protein ULS35scaffold63_32 [Phage 33_17]
MPLFFKNLKTNAVAISEGFIQGWKVISKEEFDILYQEEQALIKKALEDSQNNPNYSKPK